MREDSWGAELLEAARQWLKSLPIAWSKNQRYDIYTRRIIAQTLGKGGSGIDVGCHKGEVLKEMIKAAPQSQHFGFEPLPHLFESLTAAYAAQPQVQIYPYALSSDNGQTSFNYVISNPSYSGLKKRSYDRPHEEDTEIVVETRRLDEIIPSESPIRLIKIDVEGGELGVLQGASRILAQWQPVVVFEHGLGASDHYGSGPEEIWQVLAEAGLQPYTLESYLKSGSSLSLEAFKRHYYERLDYYYVAATPRLP